MSNPVKIIRNTLTVEKKLHLIKDSEVYSKKSKFSKKIQNQ
jgi:hypothetical protein